MSLRVVLVVVVDVCLTTICVCFCRKSTDLTWDGDEPSSAVAEEVAPPTEEVAPSTQAAVEPPVAEAPLPKARVVEGEYPS
jgi:hypothetical protein